MTNLVAPQPIAAPSARRVPGLYPLVGAFVLLYLVSLAVVSSYGLRPAIPWTFLPYMAVVAGPAAVCLYAVDKLSERRRTNVPLMIALGVAVLYAQSVLGLLAVGAVIAIGLLHFSGWKPERTRLVIALGCLCLGYATVWNLNYIEAASSHNRLNDPAFRDLDLAVYSAFFGQTLEYPSLFPIVRSSWSFLLLENAYVALFPEVILVAAILARNEERLVRFLCALFAPYFAGLVIFLMIPAVGPPIYFPNSFDPAYARTLTFSLMDGMQSEFHAVASGGTLRGFAYFIAAPSLHVTVGAVLQYFLLGSRALFWVFLPINVLMILSTVLLGYHYLVDVPAGLALAAATIWAHHRWSQSM